MKVLVAGGTGFVGSALVEALVQARNEVGVVTRNPSKRAPAGVVHIGWDLETMSLDPHSVHDYSAVVNLTGENLASGRWTDARKARFYHSRVDSVRLLCDAFDKAGVKPEVWINASAVGIYGDAGDRPLDESSPDGRGYLAELCRSWEDASERVHDLARRRVLLRIGMVLGTEGGALAKMLPLFRWGLGSRLGDGQQWMSWIHIDDLVGIIQRALVESSYQGVINAVSPNPVKNKEFTATLAAAVGRPRFLPAPKFAIKAVLGEMAQVVLGGQRVRPQKLENLGHRFRYPELKDALDHLLKSA